MPLPPLPLHPFFPLFSPHPLRLSLLPLQRRAGGILTGGRPRPPPLLARAAAAGKAGWRGAVTAPSSSSPSQPRPLVSIPFFAPFYVSHPVLRIKLDWFLPLELTHHPVCYGFL